MSKLVWYGYIQVDLDEGDAAEVNHIAADKTFTAKFHAAVRQFVVDGWSFKVYEEGDTTRVQIANTTDVWNNGRQGTLSAFGEDFNTAFAALMVKWQRYRDNGFKPEPQPVRKERSKFG